MSGDSRANRKLWDEYMAEAKDKWPLWKAARREFPARRLRIDIVEIEEAGK